MLESQFQLEHVDGNISDPEIAICMQRWIVSQKSASDSNMEGWRLVLVWSKKDSRIEVLGKRECDLKEAMKCHKVVFPIFRSIGTKNTVTEEVSGKSALGEKYVKVKQANKKFSEYSLRFEVKYVFLLGSNDF
jgi:hypothetical protein